MAAGLPAGGGAPVEYAPRAASSSTCGIGGVGWSPDALRWPHRRARAALRLIRPPDANATRPRCRWRGARQSGHRTARRSRTVPHGIWRVDPATIASKRLATLRPTGLLSPAWLTIHCCSPGCAQRGKQAGQRHHVDISARQRRLGAEFARRRRRGRRCGWHASRCAGSARRARPGVGCGAPVPAAAIRCSGPGARRSVADDRPQWKRRCRDDLRAGRSADRPIRFRKEPSKIGDVGRARASICPAPT